MSRNFQNHQHSVRPLPNFEIDFEEAEGGGTTMFLKRNSPWWTGAIGVSRVSTRAKKLAEAIAEALDEAGGKVRNEKPFK